MTRPADFYTNLITPEHNDKPKFLATVDQNTQPYQALSDALEAMPAAFDIDYAVGVQQDAVGVRIGISRDVLVPIDQGFFAFGDASHGFGVGIWKGPYSQQYGIESFDDTTYRQLQYAKVEANQGDGSVAAAKRILATFLEATAALYMVYSPDQGASGATQCTPRLVIAFSGTLPAITFMLVVSRQYLPLKPAGAVLDVYATTINGTPVFGFGMQNDYVSGFGSGSWGQNLVLNEELNI